jgi:hypothetical protein
LYSIRAADHNPILVSMHKVVVEKKLPDRMHRFTTAVGKNVALLSSPFNVKFGELVLKRVRELSGC